MVAKGVLSHLCCGYPMLHRKGGYSVVMSWRREVVGSGWVPRVLRGHCFIIFAPRLLSPCRVVTYVLVLFLAMAVGSPVKFRYFSVTGCVLHPHDRWSRVCYSP